MHSFIGSLRRRPRRPRSTWLHESGRFCGWDVWLHRSAVSSAWTVWLHGTRRFGTRERLLQIQRSHCRIWGNLKFGKFAPMRLHQQRRCCRSHTGQMQCWRCSHSMVFAALRNVVLKTQVSTIGATLDEHSVKGKAALSLVYVARFEGFGSWTGT